MNQQEEQNAPEMSKMKPGGEGEAFKKAKDIDSKGKLDNAGGSASERLCGSFCLRYELFNAHRSDIFGEI